MESTPEFTTSLLMLVMFVNEASAVLNGVPHQNLHPFVDVTKEECQLMQW